MLLPLEVIYLVIVLIIANGALVCSDFGRCFVAVIASKRSERTMMNERTLRNE